MTPSVLPDLDSLVAPVPGEDPAGKPVSFVLRQKLEDARKSVNPNDYSPTDPLRPAEPKYADWPEIVRVTQQVLAEKSKDLMTASRLVEAATRLHGFAGVRDGLALHRRLVAEAWDRLLPVIEDGDVEVRAGAFNWLDDPDRGARFPAAVRTIPLVTDGVGGITWIDWKTSQQAGGTPDATGEDPAARFAARFDKAVAAAPRAAVQDLVDDVTAAVGELDLLVKALEDRMADAAPSMSGLRQALADCQDLARRVLEKKGPGEVAPADTGTESAPAAAAAANGHPAGPTGNGPAAPRPLTRDDAYRQLADAAALLQRLEPHSPIPFMVQRAVALGRLPFPELMKVMIRDPGVVAQLSRELGLDEENPE